MLFKNYPLTNREHLILPEGLITKRYLEPITSMENQLEGSRQQNNNRDPQSMASTEKGNSFQHFKNGEGYYQASKGKQDPILFGNKPSNQTWY